MNSYKLALSKAKPAEMKFLLAYTFKIGCKLIVDGEAIGFQKDGQDIHYVTSGDDAMPPEGVKAFGSLIAIETLDNLESKIVGVVDIYKWSQQLDQNKFDIIDKINIEEEDIEIYAIGKSVEQ